MQLDNYYYWWESIFTPEECDKIIKLGKEKSLLNASTGGGRDAHNQNTNIPQNTKSTHQLKNEGIDISKVYIRKSKVAWLYDQWIYDKLWKIVTQSNKLAGWNFDVDYAEDIQFTEYSDDGFYGFHQDGGSDRQSAYKRYIKGVTPIEMIEGNLPDGYVSGKKNGEWIGKNRKLSVTVNLSDPNTYEGGDLMFDAGEHAEDGVKEIIAKEIRPRGSVCIFPSFVPHCVTPVTKGVRHSLVMWSLGRAFR